MIEFLQGKVIQATPTQLVVLVNGVGYGVKIPLSLTKEPPVLGSEVSLWIVMRVREDGISLFGFWDLISRRVFELLLTINGVGPKVSLAILSTMSLTQLHLAIRSQDANALVAVPGVGLKTAQKILFELKSKTELGELLRVAAPRIEGGSLGFDQLVEDAAIHSLNKKDDLISALINLGFKEKEIKQAVQSLGAHRFSEPFSSLMKSVLAALGKKNFPIVCEELF